MFIYSIEDELHKHNLENKQKEKKKKTMKHYTAPVSKAAVCDEYMSLSSAAVAVITLDLMSPLPHTKPKCLLSENLLRKKGPQLFKNDCNPRHQKNEYMTTL